MSDKPARVYQGVRVRTTVKELLQRRRAQEEANRKKVKTISSACLELQELSSTFPSHHVDPLPSVPPSDASGCGSRPLQLRAAPFPVSPCTSQLQESTFNDCQHQFWDMLPGNDYSGNSNNNINNNNNNNNGGGGYSSSLPPPPTLPLPRWHGLSSDADYYGPGMAACSTPESLKLCSPMDHNSYSPQDSFSSSSSSCYDSPSRMESSSLYPSFTAEHYHYQPCNLQDCYCLPHFWTGQQESFSAPEYAPYYGATDYPFACLVEENYFKRDFPVSSEMCYNVL